jgi:uncharacterized protein (DUF1697 family)
MAVAGRYVILLRGINLAGRNRVSMARLRETCAAIGCEDVRTYIASGNVVCTSGLPANALRTALEERIKGDFGFPVKVVVLTAGELSNVVDNQPFKNAESGSLHVAIAAQAVDMSAATALADLDVVGEQLSVTGRAIYFHLPNGFGRAKLPPSVDRRVKVPITVRNWRTILALSEMANPT